MRRDRPSWPTDPVACRPPSPLVRLLGLLGPLVTDGSDDGRDLSGPGDEEQVVHGAGGRSLLVRRATPAGFPLAHGLTEAADEWRAPACCGCPTAPAAPRVLLRLGGRPARRDDPCFGDWQAQGLAALAFGTLPSPPLERSGWRFPGHVLIAGGVERERLDVLAAVDRLLCLGRRPPGRTPAGRLWKHLLLGWPLPWWAAHGPGHTFEDVRREVRLRRTLAEDGDEELRAHLSELLIVVRGVERRFDEEVVGDLSTMGPGLGMHLLATVDDPQCLSAERLAVFDTRVALPGGRVTCTVRLFGCSAPAALAAHEVLLAQFPPVGVAVVASDRRDQADEAGGEESPAWESRVPAAPPPPTGGPSSEAPGGDGRGDGRTGAGASMPAVAPAPADGANAPAMAAAGAEHDAAVPAEGSGRVPVTAPETPTAAPSRSEGAVPERGEPVAAAGQEAPAIAGAATAPRLEIRCFGGFLVRCGGRELSNERREREWEVLGYLACQPAAGVGRDRLVDAIWPREDDPGKAHRLSQCFHRLRGILAAQAPGLPPDVVGTTRQGVCRLDERWVWSDAREFLALLEAAKAARGEGRTAALERARRLVTGPLFRGQRWAWLDERGDDGLLPRERFAQLWLGAVQALVKEYRQDGRLDLAIEAQREAVRRRPTDGKAIAALFELYALGGDRAGLRRAYDEHGGELGWLAGLGEEEVTPEEVERARRCARAAYTAACELLAGRDAHPSRRPERS